MVPMKKVWEARRLIMSGYSAKEVSEYLGMSVSTIRCYTKYEREKVKTKN